MSPPSRPLRTLSRLLAAVLTTVLLGGAEPTADHRSPPVSDRERLALVRGGNQFAWDLLVRLNAADAAPEGNLFFAPFSIRTALAMTYAGARGKTAEEMRRCLHLELPDDRVHQALGDSIAVLQRDPGPGVALAVANSLWVDQRQPLLAPFVQLTRDCYGSAVFPADFLLADQRERQRINAWAAERTGQRIRDLLPEPAITPLTRLVLVNAVHFDAPWSSPFQPSQTRPEPWADGPDRVPLMHQIGSYAYARPQLVDPARNQGDGLVQIVEAPYVGERFALVVLLPSRSTALTALIEALDGPKLERAIATLAQAKVDLRLPRWCLTWGTHDLGPQGRNILPHLGMEEAFLPDRADLTGMVSRPDLYIGGVHHKAFLELSEHGTEAAAATAVTGLAKSAPPVFPPPVIHDVRVDRPFLFLIRDRATGMILFLGCCRHP